MYVYVVRPEGSKYDVCEDGTMIEDGSGMCMTNLANVTTDIINSSTNILEDLDYGILASESSFRNKSQLDGKCNRNMYVMLTIYRVNL